VRSLLRIILVDENGQVVVLSGLRISSSLVSA
jgi:hypothetical protein